MSRRQFAERPGFALSPLQRKLALAGEIQADVQHQHSLPLKKLQAFFKRLSLIRSRCFVWSATLLKTVNFILFLMKANRKRRLTCGNRMLSCMLQLIYFESLVVDPYF